MKLIKYLIVIGMASIVLVMLSSESIAQTCRDVTGRIIPCPTPVPTNPPPSPADSDGDGVPDVNDQCPTAGGPAQNAGCPLPDDADGDGVPDADDQCPTAGGPAQNNGCPDSNTLPSTINLPVIAPDGACTLATLGSTNVNIRQLPSTSANIVGALIPSQIYPVFTKVVVSPTDIWYGTSGGWVFADVVRVEGDCSDLNQILQREPSGSVVSEPEQGSGIREIVVNPNQPLDPMQPVYLQICEGSGLNIFDGAQAITQCDNDVYQYDGTVRVFECYGQEFITDTPPQECIPETLEREEFTLLQSPSGDFIGVGFPIGYVGFTPDPEPPSDNDGICWNDVGDNVLPFTPAPPPPEQLPYYPLCAMMLNDINFGGEGNPALIIPIGGGNGLLLPVDFANGNFEINYHPDVGLLLIENPLDGDDEDPSDMPQWAILMEDNNLDPLAPYMKPPPEDAIFTLLEFANGVEILIGESEEDGTYVCPTTRAGFNPQPEPPVVNPGVDPESDDQIYDGLVILGFNPQPEPPALVGLEEDGAVDTSLIPTINIVGFNPQPEPPALVGIEDEGDVDSGLIPTTDIVGFNPQPEPPALCFQVGY